MIGRSLIIVESPAKCKKIEEYLGKDYKCLASYGHIRGLDVSKGIKCINVEKDFEQSFKILSNKYSVIKKLKDGIEKCKDIYIATDDDREGDAIAWHLCEILKLPLNKTKRIIFHEITKDALMNAINNPIRLNMASVESQRARQTLDVLIGFNVSPMLWKYLNQYNLSAGRCQSVALRLVYENYLSLREKKACAGYEIKGYFTDKNIPFHLEKYIEDRDKIDSFLEESVNHDHTLFLSRSNSDKGVKEIKKERNQPLPYTTSLLQQQAHSILKYSPKQTMSICQTLYENGYITYMRTDSKKYSKEFIEKASSFINKKWGNEYVSKTLDKITITNKKTKKIEKNNIQEAHEAIRPTNLLKIDIKDDNNSSIGIREIKMYHLIWCNTIESCMSPCCYYSMTGFISSPIQNVYYKHLFEKIDFPGWLIVEKIYKNKNIYEKDEEYDFIKSHSGTIEYNKIVCEYSLRNLGQHYTEASLVSLLEKHGIGRPSTYSSLVSKIQERNYVLVQDVKGKKVDVTDYILIDNEIEERTTTKMFGNEQNKLVIQPLGIMVIEYLLKYYDNIFNYEYTSRMEEMLDNIVERKMTYLELCEKAYKDISVITENIHEDRVEYELKSRNVENNKNCIYKYKITKYGPCILKTQGETKEYLKVIDDIDIEKLKNNEYFVEDIMKEENDTQIIGVYQDKNVVLKKGRYGYYLHWNEQNYSLKQMGKNISIKDITIEDFKKLVQSDDKRNIYKLSEQVSIRSGKYGCYIYYKTKKMKKPKFISLHKCPLLSKNIDLQTISLNDFEKEKIVLWCLSQ